MVHFYSGAWGEYEWECVELVMRYMYLVYGVSPYSANGDTVVSNYSGSVLTKVSNNGSSLPSPGDIISESTVHTGVVTAVNVTNGSGTVTIMQENSSSDGWGTISVSGNVLGSSVTGWLHYPDGNAYPDGTYLDSIETGAIYVVAGGAPLRVASWNNVGGPHPYTSVHQSVIDSMRPYPADGTFVNASPSGRIYVFAGGAPMRVSNWNNVGGVHSYTTVDDYAIDHQDHTLQYPIDNTYVNAMPSGRIFVFAGGAPLRVSSWNNVGGVHPYTTVDDYSVDHQDQSRLYPADGTFLNAAPSGRVYIVAGGAPLRISNWNNIGGPKPSVTVDDYAVDNLDHLLAYPADGTFINAMPSGRIFRFAGGAAMRVSSWSNIGGVQPHTTVDDYAVDNLDHIRQYPADGTVLNGGPSGIVYIVAGGAALTVSSWAAVGGVKPYTTVDDYAISNQLLPYPMDGTYVQGYQSGEVFKAMSGAVTRVYMYPTPTIVDDWAIIHQLGGTE